MAQPSLYQQVLDYANRANPYPLYTQLRQTPVLREADGTYVVSTYREIMALLHDPRVSSDERNRPGPDGGTDTPAQASETGAGSAQPGRQAIAEEPSFLALDPPEHDSLRRRTMRQFGPPHTPDRIDGMRADIERLANSLIDGFRGKNQVDIVDDFAYPLPVTVICELLGVPREDEPRFHAWADILVASLDPSPAASPAEQQRKTAAEFQAVAEMGQYLAGLVQAHRQQPGNDMLSGYATDEDAAGRMSDRDIVSTGRLLLIAGHETTVNLITNGMLTLLRHPDLLQRLRREPELIIRTVEELLRYEPPVQIMPNRTALADIPLAGATIPKGSAIVLVPAAGNRDPARFADPERFDPDREDNQHLGFGSGIHSCFGAPLARLEGQIALSVLVRRLENPRLVVDPPPYRPNPVLRGPRHLPIAFDGVSTA
jgi:cytochrome P450